MPTAVAVSVAEAVRQYLADSAPKLSQQFEPVRNYGDWDFNLKDDQKLRVDVVLSAMEQAATAATRSGLNYTVPINVCIRKKPGVNKLDDDTGELDTAELDELMLLTEEIHELFTLARLADFTAGAWQGTKILAAPVAEHIADFRQFTAIIQVTFLVGKKLECSA